MNHPTGQPLCPHCNQPLQAFALPEGTGWAGEVQFACFNDECPYYVRGWQRMDEKYGVKASYRYRVNPEAGKASPMAVWSPEAVKDRILDADLSVSTESEPEDEKGPGA